MAAVSASAPSAIAMEKGCPSKNVAAAVWISTCPVKVPAVNPMFWKATENVDSLRKPPRV